MPEETVQLLNIVWLLFFFVMGACVGSFLNVVVYRLPNDMAVYRPTFSFCPLCKKQLEWWENVPIVAWFYLRARCSGCKARISFQYPAVEIFTAVLFGFLYWWYYMAPGATAIGLGAFGISYTMAAFVALLLMVAGLIAGTLIDFKYYIIPTQITWTIWIAAIVLMPLSVFIAGSAVGPLLAERVLPHTLDFLLPIVATLKPSLFNRPDRAIFINNIGIGLAFGGLLGLAISSLLVYLKVMPRSFDDYESFMDTKYAQLQAQHQAKLEAACEAKMVVSDPLTSPSEAERASQTGEQTGVQADAQSAPQPAYQPAKNALTPEEMMDDPDMILAYPYARREMAKEVAFIAIPIVLAIIGAMLMTRFSPFSILNPQHPALIVAAGVGLGYLVGGLSIWLTRILGTLAFGKEAMGLGDVHLMAAIGAVIGASAILVTYIIAPFLGVGYWLVTLVVRGVTKSQAKIIPYGPFLAIAALLCMVWMRAPRNMILESPDNHPGPVIKQIYIDAHGDEDVIVPTNILVPLPAAGSTPPADFRPPAGTTP